MAQRWDCVNPVGEFDSECLCRWMKWIKAVTEGEPVRVLDDHDTVLEILGKSQRAAAWRLRYRGHCFLRGLVVWAHGGWQDAAHWAGVLAGNLHEGEHGGTAGPSGAANKYDTDLPTMVIGVDNNVLGEWISAGNGRAANRVGAYVARAFVEIGKSTR